MMVGARLTVSEAAPKRAVSMKFIRAPTGSLSQPQGQMKSTPEARVSGHPCMHQQPPSPLKAHSPLQAQAFSKTLSFVAPTPVLFSECLWTMQEPEPVLCTDPDGPRSVQMYRDLWPLLQHAGWRGERFRPPFPQSPLLPLNLNFESEKASLMTRSLPLI